METETGKLIIGVGVVVLLIGVVVYFFGDKLSFLGRLPGDIRVEREGFRFYFPITTMILVSLLVNLLMRAWRWMQ